MIPKRVPGPSLGEDASKKAKNAKSVKVPFHFGGYFGDLWACFLESFFHVFLEGTFFGTWATFGHPRCPRGSQMEPEWSQNGACRHLAGSARTMVFTVREAYGRSRASSGRQLFSDWVYRPSLEVSWGEFLQIWAHFGCPLGSRGAPFWNKLVSISGVRF